jgi:ribosomal protein L40E
MDEDVKVCPGCGAEFLPHIEVCNKCDLPLIRPGEERPVAMDSGDNEAALVLLESGTPGDMKWLGDRLKKYGFRPQVLNLAGGGGCCSSDGYGLFVEEPFAIDAMRKLEEIHLEASPELKEMGEQISAGRCPACGADIGFALHSCPGCGLAIG